VSEAREEEFENIGPERRLDGLGLMLQKYLLDVTDVKEKQQQTYTFSISLAKRIDSLETKVSRTIQEKDAHKGISELSDAELGAIFASLTRQWKEETINVSSVEQIVSHEAYLQIIGLGPRVIPLILAELERELDYWFWALRALARTDPVPEEKANNLVDLRNAWLDWGRANVSH
jgi:hypothetical protein